MHSSIAGDDKMNSESRDASEEVSVFRPLRCLEKSASSQEDYVSNSSRGVTI